MPEGYAGRILVADLSRRAWRAERLPEDWPAILVGGNGFAAALLLRHAEAGCDPLDGERNVLILATGPFSGTAIPCSGRVVVAAKSPLTGYFFDSYAGGPFAEHLKRSGYDALVVAGRADTPTALVISDDRADFRPAATLWGRGALEAQREIRRWLGGEWATAAIGPAGENLVRFAAILFGTRAAGRGGLGAVMGSKNLKAICVRGSRDVKVADGEGVLRLTRELGAALTAHSATGRVLPRLGTCAGLTTFNELGILGTRNWQREHFERAGQIGGEVLAERYYRRSKACPACPIGCSKVSSVEAGPWRTLSEGPEYETAYAFGPLIEVGDPEAIIWCDRACDELGMDTISAGVTIAWAAELAERGTLKGPERPPRFGDAAALRELLGQIARRRGLGELLAEGVRRAADILGDSEARECAMHVKGLELPGHSPRALKGLALGYAVGTRGASHQDMRPTPERSGAYDASSTEGKALLNVRVQNCTALGDSLIWCRYLEPVVGFLVGRWHREAVRAVTGLGLSEEQLEDVGSRVINLEHWFNVREGWTAAEDRLPPRVEEPIPEGPSSGKRVTASEIEMMKAEYYHLRGWGEEGFPRPETLRALGLQAFVGVEGQVGS